MTIERAAARRNRARDNRTKVRANWSQGLLVMLAMAPLGILGGCAGVVSGDTQPPPQAAFQLAPANLDFGSVAMGTKVSQTATVKNSGKTSIKIMQDSVTNNQFGVSGVTFPFTLAVGQSTNVSVWFNGTTPGKASGTLTVQGDGGTPPASVALSATVLASQAQLSLSTSSVNFGSVTVGAKGSSAVTVSNTGASDLTISVITINGAPFGVSGIATPKTIIAGQSATFTATFSPTAAGNDTGSIVITSNDPNSPATIALTGSGTTAAVGRLTLTPASLSFGNTAVGSNSALPTTLTNSGQATVNISQIAVSGAEFTMSGLSAPASLAPGQSVPLAVKFAPTATGNATGGVTITSNAANSPVQLTMAGTGVQAGLRVSPTSINFGSVVDGSAKPQQVSVTNTGTASLTIANATMTGAGFSVSGLATPLTLAAGQSSSFSVQFAPQTAGNLNGSLSLASNAPNSPTAIALSGTGVAATVNVGANPASVNFGNVSAGKSASTSVTISNNGNTNVTISQINVNAKDVTVSGVALPVTLAPTQNFAMSVKFSPTAAESVNGSIAVANTQGSSTTVSVAGNGVQPGLSTTPGSIAFGNVVTGASNSQTVQLSNTGSSNLTLSQANISGTGYSFSGLALPLVLTAGQTKSFNVQFTPQASGVSLGSLSLVSDAPNSPAAIALSGNGVVATFTLSVSAANLNFGNVNTGSSSTQNLTITNTGNSSVTVSQVGASGAGFSLSGAATPVTLSPAQNMTVAVQFSPAVAGGVSGSVSIVSTANGSPASVALSGTGVVPVQHSVALSWNASTSVVLGYNIYRSNSSGSGYVKQNSTLVASLNYSDASVQSGLTYYYVSTAVDASGTESVNSNEAQAIIP
jgi:hypothetical protein